MQREQKKLASVVGRDAGARYSLMCLPSNLAGFVWPAERVVIGRRVCKRLRSELSLHAGRIVMVKRRSAEISDNDVTKDFTAESDFKRLKTALKWQGSTGGLMCAVKLCPVLVHLDLSGVGIGSVGAGRLATVLGIRKDKALVYFDLGNFTFARVSSRRWLRRRRVGQWAGRFCLRKILGRQRIA
eukprot:1755994-Rhodomonas_salina.1